MDVRDIPCSIKHGLILRNCVDLEVGNFFIFQNGRDPAHLRDGLATSWPGAFAWEYVLRTPDEVRVRITKLKAVAAELDLTAGHECSH